MTRTIIVNAGTKEAALKEYNDFMYQTKTGNRHISIFLVAVILAWFLSMFAIADFVPENWQWTAGFAASIIAGIFAFFLCKAYESSCSYFWPATYQYHKMLEDYRILKVEVERRGDCQAVRFTVANKNNEVSHKWIYGFQSVMKTDVQSISIDLANKKICEPYVE